MLHDIGIKYGTDKATDHKFCDFYEKILPPLQSQISLLEVGVFRGASAQMWHEYYNAANLYFIDIDPHCVGNVPQSSKFDVVDCRSDSALKKYSEDKHWDVVIDDGAHTYKTMQLTFRRFWPRLNRDGIYIVEDIHTNTHPVNSERYNIWNPPGDNVKSSMLDLCDLFSGKDVQFSSQYFPQEEIDKIKCEIDWVLYHGTTGHLTCAIKKK